MLMNEEKRTGKIALLIDGDNVSAFKFDELSEQLSRRGDLKIKRVYGDFSSPAMNSWKERSVRSKLSPVQQFQKKNGNATDMRLIIDAMDILYTCPEIDMFCIASSDADYCSLVVRLQEACKHVIVAGGIQISTEMRAAADEIIVLGLPQQLEESKNDHEDVGHVSREAEEPVKKGLIVDKTTGKIYDYGRAPVRKMTVEDLLTEAFISAKKEDGWCKRVSLGVEVSKIKKLGKEISYPEGLDSSSRLRDLIDACPDLFEESGSGLDSCVKLRK